MVLEACRVRLEVTLAHEYWHGYIFEFEPARLRPENDLWRISLHFLKKENGPPIPSRGRYHRVAGIGGVYRSG